MDSGHHAYTRFEPAGVVAAIAPWNFPLMLESWKVTGKTIAGAAAANLVPVSLELGGKGANIVFDDADLDNAVAWSIRAIFSNAGQVCLAGSRLYVQRGIYAEFTDRFVAAAKALRSAPTWTASRPTAARSGPAASATAGWCCPPWWRTPRRPRASAARRCSARW